MKRFVLLDHRDGGPPVELVRIERGRITAGDRKTSGVRVRTHDAPRHWQPRNAGDPGVADEVGRFGAALHSIRRDGDDIVVSRHQTPLDPAEQFGAQDQGSTPGELMAAGGPLGMGGGAGPAVTQTAAPRSRDAQPPRSLMAGRVVRDYSAPSRAQAEQEAQRVRDKDVAVRADDARRLKLANAAAKAFWRERGGR
jgi:hypothetical protein